MLAFFGINGQVTDSSALSLISICTTLIVGVSVVDVVRLEKLEKKIDELKELRRDVDKQKNELEELRDNANIALDANWGFTLVSVKPQTAVVQLWKAIEKSFKKEDTKRANTCISVLENVIKIIEKDNQIKQELRKETDGHVPIEITESLEYSSLYDTFKSRLEKILQKIETIIKD